MVTVATYPFRACMAQTINGVTTYFIGNYYEVTKPGSGRQVTKYYFAGTTRIAMRKYTIPLSMSVEYLLGDHLGSTSITTDANGAKVSELRYKPWGEVRYSWTAGLSTTPAYELAKYTFTGQYSYMDDPSTAGATEGFGLMFYNARWYDPTLGRFAQADSIVPEQSQGVQAWDRFAYVNNNPVKYTDPTGHCIMLCTLQPKNAAAFQAIGLVLEWFFELGEQIKIFGPTEPITEEVMKQSGVDDFYEEWADSGFEDGYKVNTTIDDRTLPLIPRLIEWSDVFVQSHFIDLPLALMGDEDHSAIPGTIGSLDEITATYTDDGQVKIEVHNTMGWASGTRISTWSLLPNADRSDSWFGGTTEQYFYWYVEDPRQKGDPQWR